MEYAIGYKQPEVKKAARQKPCKRCGELNFVSKKNCGGCNFSFYEKKEPRPPKKHRETSIEEVKVGDTIFILTNDFWKSPEGENIGMSDSGSYLIIKITSQGILGHDKHGFTFFDMVNEGYNPKTGITRGKTRLFKRGNNPQPKR